MRRGSSHSRTTVPFVASLGFDEATDFNADATSGGEYRTDGRLKIQSSNPDTPLIDRFRRTSSTSPVHTCSKYLPGYASHSDTTESCNFATNKPAASRTSPAIIAFIPTVAAPEPRARWDAAGAASVATSIGECGREMQFSELDASDDFALAPADPALFRLPLLPSLDLRPPARRSRRGL